MATLTPQQIDNVAGLPSLTWNAVAGGGDVFPNDGKTVVVFRNTNAATRVVTFGVNGKAPGGFAIAAPTITVPATTGFSVFGPFDPTTFNNSSGQVAMTYSASTNLDVGVAILPR